jgi:hypothetical protein
VAIKLENADKPLSIARQNSRLFAILRSASALRFARWANLGCKDGPPVGFVAMKAAVVAVQTTEPYPC